MIEPIRRSNFEGPGRNEVQEAVAREVEAAPDKFIDRFKALPQSLNGRFISADTFKETFDQYRESNEARNVFNSPVHNSAAVLASEQLRRLLQEPPKPGRNLVMLLTGIPGAGKTSAVLQKGDLPAATHAVYEGQLSDAETAIAKVQQVLEAGFKPVIVAVHPMPERALDNTLQRFEEVGRGASINTMARIQGGLPAGLAAVRDKFGKAVELRVVDRRNFAEPQQLKGWKHLSTLESEGNHERIKQRLEQHLEARREDLSTDAYRQAAGLPPIVRNRCDDGRSIGQHEGAVDRRNQAQDGGENSGLKVPSSEQREAQEADTQVSKEAAALMETARRQGVREDQLPAFMKTAEKFINTVKQSGLPLPSLLNPSNALSSANPQRPFPEQSTPLDKPSRNR